MSCGFGARAFILQNSSAPKLQCCFKFKTALRQSRKGELFLEQPCAKTDASFYN